MGENLDHRQPLAPGEGPNGEPRARIERGRRKAKGELSDVVHHAKAPQRSEAATTKNAQGDPKQWNKEMKDFVAELRNGKVPQYLLENHRLVPFESAEGRAFQECMVSFFKEIYDLVAQR